ncbi:MAG: VWA domain-containing protein [Thermoguttaceae bacterium]|nr:VWA domain-containing protein [Thermoguttaceae bacterium]
MLTKRINPVAILAVLAFALIASTALAQELILDEPVSTSAEMYTYKDAASGEQYFALSVSPSPTEMPASGRNIVIVADTSASIAANYRQQELDTIKTFVSSLNPATDKVCLVASDVDSSELTKGFVSPDSEEFQNAYKALEDRVPLGAMNIETAMKTAASQPFNAGNNSIMFIGSGTSRAKTLSPAQFDAICKDLASKKLPVNSVQIGPNPDARVLSCLAAKTGGMSIVPSDDANQSVSDTVAAMDSATAANVVWPDQASVKWPASFKPAMDFPPLRTDRDSMIVGTYTGDGSLDLTANTSDGAQSWSAKPENTAEKFDYIKQLVTMANGSNGLVPLVSKEDMYKAENAMFDRVNELTRLANSAISTGDIQDAQNLVNELKNLDPQNADVQNLEKLIAENGNGQAIALDDGPTDFDLLDSSGLLDSADSSMGAITQQQVGEVTRTINDARATLRIDPEGAIQNLKNMREAVRRNADIKAADRDALVRNLEAAIREAQQYGDQMAQRNAEAARRMAEAQDRKILAEQMMSQLEKMNQMGKRFESTCKEKKYEQAQDLMVDMANEMSDLDNRMPTAIAGIQWTRNLDNYVKQVQLRSLKQRKVCDTLYQSDKSAVPFPDEPPITYPDSTVWARLTASRRAKYSSMDLAQSGEKEKQIMKALKEPTNIELTESPLKDAIQEIHDQHHINVQIDEAAFKDEMISPEEVTLSVDGNGMSLKAALKIALSAQNLSYVIENECLYITTLTKAKEKCITKVYPVADLVMPPRMPDMSNVFTSMGNNTTSMSNSGTGGGNNNNFGGGQFNIPAERLRLNAAKQAIQNDNFQAFNMKDDLSQSVPAVKTELTPDGSVIVVPASIDKKDFWKNYFQRKDVNDSLVRKTMLHYKHENKYNDIIIALQEAMLAGKAQPWMYEALALAQLCAGRPQSEYERTLMSAVEFSDDAQTMILIAVYMQRLGLHDRALQVLHEIAKNNPEMAEPYEKALPIASITNNREAKKWASLGILSLAWQEEKQYLYDKANDVANSVVADLIAENKKQEAKEFQEEINNAKQRDCIIRVSWTGQADIDIAVEEPGGTVCSMKNIQTPAGGFFMGDAHAGQLGKNNKAMSETYVCPKGFNGDYRLAVKKLWGNVIGGKVKVELFTHVNADDLNSLKGKKPMVGYIQLKDDAAGMMFTLHDGRRTAASQQVIANAVNNQVNRAILAQQLAQAFDPNAMAKLDGFVNADQAAEEGRYYYPYYRQGAVGYQPQIITLPTGTNLMAQAVVSADRRYVRITSVPMFSYIANVRIFNYVTGEESQGEVPTGSGTSY